MTDFVKLVQQHLPMPYAAAFAPAADAGVDDEVTVSLDGVDTGFALQLGGGYVGVNHMGEDALTDHGTFPRGQAAEAAAKLGELVRAHDDTRLLALAKEALPLDDDDWGSERQIEAENDFADAVGRRMTLAQGIEHEQFCIKATTVEATSFALQVVGIDIAAIRAACGEAMPVFEMPWPSKQGAAARVADALQGIADGLALVVEAVETCPDLADDPEVHAQLARILTMDAAEQAHETLSVRDHFEKLAGVA